jgi:hypothetical protein
MPQSSSISIIFRGHKGINQLVQFLIGQLAVDGQGWERANWRLENKASFVLDFFPPSFPSYLAIGIAWIVNCATLFETRIKLTPRSL